MLSESISHFEWRTVRDIASHWTVCNCVTFVSENMLLLIVFVMSGVLSLFYLICAYMCMILKARLSWDMTSRELVINYRCFDLACVFLLGLRSSGHYRCEYLRVCIICILLKLVSNPLVCSFSPTQQKWKQTRSGTH